MAGKKKAPLWRQAFLRALRRTGNVRASAFEAGVDPGTAYDHRAKDAGFRAKWDEAKKRKAGPLHHASHGPPPRSGEELIVRRTKHGDKLVRASPGGWCSRIEESFLDGLEETGCVRTAARAAGISTAALYERKKHYPEFAARWDERAGRAGTQLPGLVEAAAVETLSPEGAKRRGRSRRPVLTGADAVRVYAISQNAKAKAGRGELPQRDEDAEREALVQTLAGLFDMLERRQDKARRADGWQDAGGGIWVPPGWTPSPGWTPPSPEDGGNGDSC